VFCFFLKIQVCISVTVVFDFEITVENVVMIGAFSEGIDLSVANQKLRGPKRNWKQLSGLSFKLKRPSATFLLPKWQIHMYQHKNKNQRQTSPNQTPKHTKNRKTSFKQLHL